MPPDPRDSPAPIRKERYTSDSFPFIHSVDDWIRILHTHAHEEFAKLVAMYADDICPPYTDVSAATLLHPFYIQHHIYGSGQGSHEVQDCLERFF